MFWNTKERVEVMEYETLGKYTATIIIIITGLVCCNIKPEQMIQDDVGMVIVVL